VTAEPGYRGETERGIKIGSTLDEVTKAYGAAYRTVVGRQGVYHAFDGNGILFQTDELHGVSRRFSAPLRQMVLPAAPAPTARLYPELP